MIHVLAGIIGSAGLLLGLFGNEREQRNGALLMIAALAAEVAVHVATGGR